MATDISAVEKTISGLGKRQFVLRTTRSPDLPLLTTRWAMSYLAGPLTGDQITTLMADEIASLEQGSATAASHNADAGTAEGHAAEKDRAAGAPEANGTAAGSGDADQASGSPLADDESTLSPSLPDSLIVRYPVAAAPWLGAVDAQAGGRRLVAHLAARVELLFDETKAKLRHSQEWEAIIPIGPDGPDVDQAISVDFDDRDFTADQPADSVYVLPAIELTATAIKRASTELKAKLYSDETVTLHHNAALKLWSRPDENIEDFQIRCEAAADDGADAEAEKIRTKIEKKRDSVEAALAKAEDRTAELETQAQGRKQQQWVDIGSSLLGGLLGGRRKARGLASAARRMSSGRRQTASTESRLESARNRVAEKIDELEELEYEIQEALIEIDDEWSTKASTIEQIEVPLEKSDINIEDMMLVWLPVD